MAERRKPGHPPKGDRKSATVRLPREHIELYADRAEQLGYKNLNDYFTALLAEIHGLEPPPYIARRPSGNPVQQPLMAS